MDSLVMCGLPLRKDNARSERGNAAPVLTDSDDHERRYHSGAHSCKRNRPSFGVYVPESC